MENPLLKGRGRNKNVSATLRDEGNIPFPRIQVLFMGEMYNERERERWIKSLGSRFCPKSKENSHTTRKSRKLFSTQNPPQKACRV